MEITIFAQNIIITAGLLAAAILLSRLKKALKGWSEVLSRPADPDS